MAERPLLAHLVPAREWEVTGGTGHYHSSSLATDGFIHMSTFEQVAATADRYYRDTPGLLLVTIDPERLEAELVYEDTSGHGDFPHLYGPLNLDAVVAVEPYVR